MAKKEVVQMNELWIDGIKRHEWNGSKSPIGIKRLVRLRGVEHKLYFVDAEGVESAEDKGLARSTDPDTSQSAADTVDVESLQEKVLNAINSFGAKGCISDDVMGNFPFDGPQTITPRYKPLLNKGLIWDTGDRRKGGAGKDQRVMVAAQFKEGYIRLRGGVDG